MDFKEEAIELNKVYLMDALEGIKNKRSKKIKRYY